MTICLFVGFLNIGIRSEKISKAIVSVAPLTLGVYLIHAHANVSPWSWEVLNLPSQMNSVAFPLVQLVSVLGIFVVCAAIDAIRKSTIGRIENSKFVTTGCNFIQEKMNSLSIKLIKE